MRRRKSAYIYVLPSMLTTGNLFFGFYSIVRSFNHDYERAAYALFIAAIFDLLDGRVARMTRSTSQFGVEYDSIADVLSFGAAPAVLAYCWALNDYGRLGFASAFFFVACGALRLARFNSNVETLPKSYFLGLPIPAAALFIASIAIGYTQVPFAHVGILLLVLMFLLGLLMASNIRYRSMKDFDVRHRRRFIDLVPLVSLIAFVAIRHEVAVPIVLASYVLWGPVREGLGLLFRRGPKPRAAESQSSESDS